MQIGRVSGSAADADAQESERSSRGQRRRRRRRRRQHCSGGGYTAASSAVGSRRSPWRRNARRSRARSCCQVAETCRRRRISPAVAVCARCGFGGRRPAAAARDLRIASASYPPAIVFVELEVQQPRASRRLVITITNVFVPPPHAGRLSVIFCLRPRVATHSALLEACTRISMAGGCGKYSTPDGLSRLLWSQVTTTIKLRIALGQAPPPFG